MKSINQFLIEFYPSHPSDTVIKNDFYPRGLSELQVYNYYLSVKDKLLQWIDGRNVAFLIRTEPDKTVLIRNQRGKLIYLNHSNYEDLITGRTNVIYVIHQELTNYWIIDIDIGPNLTMKHCKLALDILLKQMDMDKIDELGTIKTETLFTSPKGIHLIGYLKHPNNINLLREALKQELSKIISTLNKKTKIQFTVNEKGRHHNKINFDLSSMYDNSLHIARYSLTKEFLICDDIKEGIKRVK